MSNLNSSKTIAKNSVFLFFRTLLILFVTLYVSRVVLNALGVIDYGIYNVIGGVVAMLTFLNSAMVQASQRYITFAQCEGNYEKQKLVFSTSVYIHLTIAFIVLILLETLGLWYVNNYVVLPPERLFAANVIYQFAVLVFLTKIIVVPFTASVIAHEKMQVYAYVSIIDAFLQLGIAYIITFSNYDRLILYGALMLCVAAINLLLYYIYCKTKFFECKMCWRINKSLYREMFDFASWAFVGGVGYIARSQGVNLVINSFCGPAVNAARGVAYQVGSAVQSFMSTFLQAINPQITKRYAKDEINSMMKLVFVGSKYTYLMLLICFTPIIVMSEYVLALWLGNVPEYASEFLIMVIAMVMITSMGEPFNTAMQATGNIKKFQIVVSIIMCCDIPLSYILLKVGVEPYWATGVSIVSAFVCLIAKAILLYELVKYDIKDYMLKVVFKNLMISILAIPFFFYVSTILPKTFVSLLLMCILSIVVYAPIIILFGMDKTERNFVSLVIKKYIKKIK